MHWTVDFETPNTAGRKRSYKTKRAALAACREHVQNYGHHATLWEGPRYGRVLAVYTGLERGAIQTTRYSCTAVVL